MAAKLNLDKLDLQIIHEMMETAEVSYADLGKKLFVSGGTIHVRIKKLQEFGIVKGTKLNVDVKQLGYDITAFVFATTIVIDDKFLITASRRSI